MSMVSIFIMFTMFTMGNDKKKNLSMVSMVAMAVEGKASKRQTAHQAILVQIPFFWTNMSKKLVIKRPKKNSQNCPIQWLCVFFQSVWAQTFWLRSVPTCVACLFYLFLMVSPADHYFLPVFIQFLLQIPFFTCLYWFLLQITFLPVFISFFCRSLHPPE